VLAVVVRAGRTDLDLDPEELGICVDDQRSNSVAEIQDHGLRADIRRIVVMVMVVIVRVHRSLQSRAGG